LDSAVDIGQLEITALVVNTTLDEVLGGADVQDGVVPAWARRLVGELGVLADGLGDQTCADGTRLGDGSADSTLEVASGAGKLDVDAAVGTLTGHDAVVKSVGAVDVDLGENTTSVISTTLDLVSATGRRCVFQSVPAGAARCGSLVVSTETQSVKKDAKVGNTKTSNGIPTDSV